MKLFADVNAASALVGISVKQFLRAAKILELTPREFGTNKRHIWTTAVLIENKDALVALTGKGHKHQQHGARLPNNHVCR